MPALPALHGVDVKLARARRHIDELCAEVDAVLAVTKQRLVKEVGGTPPAVVYRIYGIPAIRPEWSAIVGDVLTNLRSALDHLAWQLVLLDGGRPTGRTVFPLAASPTDSRGRPTSELRPALRSRELRDAVEAVQPYAIHNPPQEARNGFLWQMRDLCNRDKHRELLVVASMPDVGGVWWGLGLRDASPHVTMNPKPEKDGEWVLRFDFRGDDPPATFDPHVGDLIVVLDEGPPLLRTSPIQGTIRTMYRLVAESVIGWRFRSLFEGDV